MRDQDRSTVQFPALDELRGLAALSVIVHHIERNKNRLGYPSLFGEPALVHFVSHLGQLGVSCFFVLSGFLMTFLLVTEHRRTGRIHVRAFYMRRILRIWPLYFFIVAIAFVIIPWITPHIALPGLYRRYVMVLERHYRALLALFVCMLPNVALRFY